MWTYALLYLRLLGERERSGVEVGPLLLVPVTVALKWWLRESTEAPKLTVLLRQIGS